MDKQYRDLVTTEEQSFKNNKEQKHKEMVDSKINFIKTLKNIQNGIFTMKKNDDGKLFYTVAIGKLMEEIGAGEDIILNHSPHEVFTEEIANIKQLHYEKAFQGERVNYEIELKGKRLFIDITPIKTAHVVTEILGTVLDISELRSIQKELQVNQEQMNSLLNFSQDYLIIFNQFGQIINMNFKAKELFELTNKKVDFLKLEKNVIEQYVPNLNEFLDQALKGNFKHFELDVLSKQNEKMFFSATFFQIIVDNIIVGAYLIGKDITEQKRIQDLNAYLAHHDELTTLFNRRWIEQKMKDSIQEASRINKKLAVMFIDLDRFKLINDTLGHFIGDELLKEIGKRILNNINQENHFAARMGGDEFTILCTDVESETSVFQLAETFLQDLTKPIYIEGLELLITASMGISFYPSAGIDVVDLMKKADIALYRAKELGRNMYQVYDHSMIKQNYQSFLLERDLRKAILNNEFTVYLQPKVDALTGKIISAEALIRWKHPQLGLISPSDFIPMAEETGLIIPLGKWIKRKVCEQLVKWREKGLSIIPISVNITSKRFLQKEFSKEIRQLLDEFHLEGKWLEIEITENSIMRNEENVLQTLRELKELGVKIYIDDFGTGYSSFHYLKTFHLDGIKIDRSFIQNISSESENASITAAMIKMAQQLKLEVIAEGVETKEELNYLLELNCHYIQGFYFGKPCPIEDFKTKYLL
ncbi:EAL domain-containing protein [Ureibacillus sp. 179-F W5.1 NHS]|uniref:EAL domain-containing protein n=1 Tax=Ureibacillus sp. 179-F W5.1 NHS TaxID=3374297 RepID=UPI00387A7E9C